MLSACYLLSMNQHATGAMQPAQIHPTATEMRSGSTSISAAVNVHIIPWKPRRQFVELGIARCEAQASPCPRVLHYGQVPGGAAEWVHRLSISRWLFTLFDGEKVPHHLSLESIQDEIDSSSRQTVGKQYAWIYEPRSGNSCLLLLEVRIQDCKGIFLEVVAFSRQLSFRKKSELSTWRSWKLTSLGIRVIRDSIGRCATRFTKYLHKFQKHLIK